MLVFQITYRYIRPAFLDLHQIVRYSTKIVRMTQIPDVLLKFVPSILTLLLRRSAGYYICDHSSYNGRSCNGSDKIDSNCRVFDSSRRLHHQCGAEYFPFDSLQQCRGSRRVRHRRGNEKGAAAEHQATTHASSCKTTCRYVLTLPQLCIVANLTLICITNPIYLTS